MTTAEYFLAAPIVVAAVFIMIGVLFLCCWQYSYTVNNFRKINEFINGQEKIADSCLSKFFFFWNHEITLTGHYKGMDLCVWTQKGGFSEEGEWFFTIQASRSEPMLTLLLARKIGLFARSWDDYPIVCRSRWSISSSLEAFRAGNSFQRPFTASIGLEEITIGSKIYLFNSADNALVGKILKQPEMETKLVKILTKFKAIEVVDNKITITKGYSLADGNYSRVMELLDCIAFLSEKIAK